ncbi:hypothetical protein A9179_12410 [Pseudomonas alcaligenes]|uniref:Uncharacterized protein n=1 Tax=Aquipseudomonas alcaligenes TaxID=43263 RepID=A0ABR7S1S3_AQUAC|nr:hypothetical protein [Pseudomonas alcaligenes]MBC9251079.1 hypothetical protein [Pseudomonas alcaligenes]
MAKVNIVVGFTPYHALFAERLIAELEGQTWCLFSKGWPAGGGYRRLGCFSRRYTWLHGLTYLLSFVHFALRVRWFWLKGADIELYAPHPGNIFSNYLFFSAKVRAVHVYEDGLLNYYDAPAEKFSLGRSLRRLAALGGLPYRDFSGHLAGYASGRVDTLYVSRAARVVARQQVRQVVQLASTAAAISPVAGRVLFLEQNTAAFISAEQREELLARMFALYPRDRYAFFCKGHHDFAGDGLGMENLDAELAKLPAEQVVQQLRPQVVVSFFSSALLNIASVHPEIDCVALAAGHVAVTRDGVGCSLSDIFTEAGVTCFPLEPLPAST